MSSFSDLRNKNYDIFMAAFLVLLFAALLAMMYGWVGTARSVGGEMGETPEGQWVASQVPGSANAVGGNNPRPLIKTTPATVPPAQTLPGPVSIGIGTGAAGQLQLISTRPPVYLGAQFGAVTDSLAASFGLTTTLGLHVQEVGPDTPAAKAGLQMDDVLLAIDRQQIRDLDQMLKILSAKQAGDTVKIVYFRHGKQVTGYLTLGKPPDLLPVAANTTATLAPAVTLPAQTVTGPVSLGAELQNIDAALKTQFKLANKRGVIISAVTPASPAAQAGLVPGDVIVRCDKTTVNDLKQFQKLMAGAQSGVPINLRINRAGQEQDLTLTLGAAPVAPAGTPALVTVAAVGKPTPTNGVYYSDTIKNIIARDCSRCHSGASRNLMDYDPLKAYAVSGRLRGMVSPGGPMSRYAGNDAQTIVDWIDQGSPEKPGKTQGLAPNLAPALAANPASVAAPNSAPVPPPFGANPAPVASAPPWLGAEIQNIDAVIEKQFKLPNRRGVIISYVTPASPAAQSGLIEGDVIIRYNQANVKDVQRFQDLLAKVKAGVPVAVRIIRAGKEQDLTLVLGIKPLATVTKPPKLPPADVVVEASWIGMDVSELRPKDAQDFGFPVGTCGILVTDVEGPPALDVGFQAGDLILAINSTPTLTIRDFERGSRQLNGAVVDVMRGNRHLFVTVPPPGYTQQGTALATGPSNNFQQVAATQASPGRIAIIVAGPSLGAPVASDQQPSASLLLIDPAENSFTRMDLLSFAQMQDVIKQNQVVALICSSLSARSAAGYAVMGVKVYTGVIGTADQALSQYRTGTLTAMK